MEDLYQESECVQSQCTRSSCLYHVIPCGPQLQSLVEDLRQESECLQSQVAQERATVKNLEGLLQNGREKEFQSQLTSQERNTEIQMLKDRLSLNESKM